MTHSAETMNFEAEKVENDNKNVWSTKVGKDITSLINAELDQILKWRILKGLLKQTR